MFGYAGRVLKVDLTTRKIETEELDGRIASEFLGSCGISARLAYDLIQPGTDPLSPQNSILVGTGSLCDTPVAAPRCTIVTRFPLTGAIAFACSGMGLGTRLKRAGYDTLIIRGRADKPVYLRISDSDIEICDAKGLWGKTIPQATEELWARHGKGYSVIAIGPAGENLVKLSLALIDRIASAGKGGLAAVMGSKNLKAVVVSGTGRPKLADPERFREAVNSLPKTVSADPKHMDYMDNPDLLKEFGKIPFFDAGIKKTNGVAYKNWTEVYSAEDAIARYGFEVFKTRVKRSPVTCLGCNHPCKDLLEINDGEYKGEKIYISSTLGRIRDLGIRCGAESPEKVLKAFDLANQYGIDCHIFAPVMDLAVDLYERGVITDRDTEGLVLKRDFETTVKLIEQIAFKQGIGATLGDGSLGIIRRFGKEYEKDSVHIKGLEPQTDPRNLRFTMEVFGHMVNPRGATLQPAHSGGFRVVEGFSQNVVRDYCNRIGIPPEATKRILDVPFGYNVARLTPYGEDFYLLLTCLGICNHRTHLFSFARLAELHSAATGFETSSSEILEASQRVWNTFKALNVREGFSRKDDRVPPKWLEPLKTANGEEVPLMGCEGKVLSAPDVQKLLDDYYDERGWDIQSGVPSKERLTELRLDDIAEDLSRRGAL